MDKKLSQYLVSLADKYETADFLIGDPSCFMHQVEGNENRETIAFVASALSYGSRKQLLPKIQFILDKSDNCIYNWIKNGEFESVFVENNKNCFYRLYSFAQMNSFFRAYQKLIINYSSLGNFLKINNIHKGLDAVEIICNYFSSENVKVIIPKDAKSACKRVCMFLRWMVRDKSPVDLGLWSDFIDKSSLIIPLDTHVMQQANKLQIINRHIADMKTAIYLTSQLKEVFPDDPLRGDFALFGLGISISDQRSVICGQLNLNS